MPGTDLTRAELSALMAAAPPTSKSKTRPADVAKVGNETKTSRRLPLSSGKRSSRNSVSSLSSDETRKRSSTKSAPPAASSLHAPLSSSRSLTRQIATRAGRTSGSAVSSSTKKARLSSSTVSSADGARAHSNAMPLHRSQSLAYSISSSPSPPSDNACHGNNKKSTLATPPSSRCKKDQGREGQHANANSRNSSASAMECRAHAAKPDKSGRSRKWRGVLECDVKKRKMLFDWASANPTWEKPARVVSTQDGLDEVLCFLSNQEDASEDLSDWLSNLQTLKAKLATGDGVGRESTDNILPVAKELAFCCSVCTCTEQQKKEDPETFVSAGNSGNDNLWHRSCRHGFEHIQLPDWISPLKQAIEASTSRFAQEDFAEIPPETCSLRDLKKRVVQAAREEKRVANESTLIDPTTNRLRTNKNYLRHCQVFQETRSRPPKRATMIEIGPYGRIGEALVALKVHAIAVETYIYVDIDPVAEHVCRSVHDKSYNASAPDDGINYDFSYKSLEELSACLDAIMEKHAPIDLIVGGSLRSDHTIINARKKGGEEKSYLSDLADFIRRIRSHPKQGGIPVFFLAENAVCGESSSEGQRVEAAFGVPRACIDARMLSPCKRNRAYYTSIPVKPLDVDGAVSQQPASICLTDGWKLAAEVANQNPNAGAFKANTFMAHGSKIDDARMMKVRPLQDYKDAYEIGYINANEREVMLGFPEDYVKRTVDDLFTNLSGALMAELEQDATWRGTLNDKYKHFANQDFKYGMITSPPFFEVKMSPPTIGHLPEFFTSEGYSKHLLGNSFSIPVLGHLLQPLQKVFQKKQYKGFRYQFQWHTTDSN